RRVYWSESLRCIGDKLCRLSVHSPQRFSPCNLPAGIVGRQSVRSQRWYPALFPAGVYLFGVVQTHGIDTMATVIGVCDGIHHGIVFFREQFVVYIVDQHVELIQLSALLLG